jgi:tripartite-type tricarboxylate transporter receptor subunit TctC
MAVFCQAFVRRAFRNRPLIHRVMAAAAGAIALFSPAAAQTSFKDKSITMIVGASAGGGNDLYARLLARHMGHHLEGNPGIIVKNMTGAGGAAAASTLYANAPKDGTMIGAVTRVTTLDPLLSSQTFPFDPLKFTWLGSLNKETNLIIVSDKAPVTTFEEVFSKEVIVAAAGANTDGVVYPRLINNLMGGKFKIVSGYAGSDEMMLAVERGEVHGRGGVPWSTIKLNHADLLKSGKIRIIVQLALHKDPELPNVPLLMDYVKDENHRKVFELLFARQEMGRPFVAPPDLPDAVVQQLRSAFNAAAADPQLLAEAAKQNLDIQLLTGDEMQTLLMRLYATPQAIVDIAKKELEAK